MGKLASTGAVASVLSELFGLCGSAPYEFPGMMYWSMVDWLGEALDACCFLCQLWVLAGFSQSAFWLLEGCNHVF